MTSGVACFQRAIDKIIHDKSLAGIFAYISNITVCWRSKEDHNKTLADFLGAAKKHSHTLNDEKSVVDDKEVRHLVCEVSHGLIKPDPERLLQELLALNDLNSEPRSVGLCLYYSNWILGWSSSAGSQEIIPLAEQRQGIFRGTQKWAWKRGCRRYRFRNTIGRRTRRIRYSCFCFPCTERSTSSILSRDTIEKWRTSLLCSERSQRYRRSYIEMETIYSAFTSELLQVKSRLLSCLTLDNTGKPRTRFRGEESNSQIMVLTLSIYRVVIIWRPTNYPEASLRRIYFWNHWKNCTTGAIRVLSVLQFLES